VVLFGARTINIVLLTELKSDGALELGVLGFVNDAHAPAAKLFYNFVVRDGLADHCGS